MYNSTRTLGLTPVECEELLGLAVEGLEIPRNGVSRGERAFYHATDSDETIMCLGPLVKKILGLYLGAWRHARVLTVFPSGLVNLHVDNGMEKKRRYHLVLETNADAWSFHGESWQQLKLGCLYTVNPAIPHAAVNFGKTPRTHLFFDVDA